MAVLLIAAFCVRFVQIPGPGVFGVLRVHSIDLGHAVLLLHTRTLAFLRCQHVRVGAICVAHGQGHLCSNHHPVDAIRVLRSRSKTEGREAHAGPFGLVQAVCRSLHRVSRRDSRVWVQIVHRVSNETKEAEGCGQGERILRAVDAASVAGRFDDQLTSARDLQQHDGGRNTKQCTE